jgi:hypothetical protein
VNLFHSSCPDRILVRGSMVVCRECVWHGLRRSHILAPRRPEISTQEFLSLKHRRQVRVPVGQKPATKNEQFCAQSARIFHSIIFFHHGDLSHSHKRATRHFARLTCPTNFEQQWRRISRPLSLEYCDLVSLHFLVTHDTNVLLTHT